GPNPGARVNFMRLRLLLFLCLSLGLATGTNLVAAVGNGHGLPFRPPKAIASELPRVRFVATPGSSILLHGTYPKVSSSCVAPILPILQFGRASCRERHECQVVAV